MRVIFVLLIACLLHLQCLGQTYKLGKVDILHFKVLQLIHREIHLEYEKYLHKNYSLGISLAYRDDLNDALPNFRGFGRLAENSYKIQNMLNPHYKAIKIGLQPKWYFNWERKMFIATELLYRHWWVNNKRIIYTNESYSYEPDPEDLDSFDTIRKEKINVFGIQATFGATFNMFKLAPKVRVYFIPSAGFGYRIKKYTYESFGGIINEEPNIYKKENDIYETGTVHLTCTVGLSFTK